MPRLPKPPTDPAILHVARGLARAFLHEAGGVTDLQQRGKAALGTAHDWLPRMVRRLNQHFGLPLRPAQFNDIVTCIATLPSFIGAFERRPVPKIRRYFSFQPQMAALPHALSGLDLPALPTVGDLAAWLALSMEELEWLADVHSISSKAGSEALRHYHYQWKAKASGGHRLIESPKPLLCAIQRKILHGLLDKIPVHDAAHGCVPHRSILSNAQVHAGSPLILKMDLQDFFTSIRASRVHALFRTLGYPEEVARYLTALTTHVSASCVLNTHPRPEGLTSEVLQQRHRQAESYRARHLPQGAPSSAALANLCAWRLDLRLAAAAQESGARYTRYVDDLIVSFPEHTRTHAWRISLMISTIILEEGFTPHPRKTRLTSQSQAQWVTGVLINEKPNIARSDYDRLKATLTNCVRHGPHEQNRESHPDFRAHLQGRIAHVKHINPARGEKLQTLFAKIHWDKKL